MAFATAFGTLMSGAFLVGYMKTLGASDLWINLLAALPSLVGVLQIPGGILGRGVHSYKRFVSPGGLGWRLLYVPIVALPLAAWSGNTKLMVLTISVTVASVFTTFVGPVYNDWISHIIPESARGFYFARRNAIAAAVGAAVGIVGAFLLDGFREHGAELQGFTVVFALAILCAAISWYFYQKMGDLVRPNPERQSLAAGLAAIKTPFADKRFRAVLFFLGATMVGQTFAGNLFVAYARESLSLDYKIIQGTAVSMALGNVAAAAAWGFLADRFGNKPVLIFTGLALVINPIPWILCIPNNANLDAAILLGAHFYMGVIWAGINLCQFNVMLETAPVEDRANYIGAGTTVTALVGGIAPLLGGAAMELLRGHMPVISAYRWIFAVTAALRLLAVVFLIPVQEPGSSRFKAAMKEVSGVSLGGVRALRTLTRSGDVGRRESAIETAGNAGIGLASDEIIKALHDPLPNMRRQAASALAKLNDPRAIEELVHQIVDHPDLLEEETVNALGAIGNLIAFPSLVDTLSSPRPLLRRAAARALGQIGARLDTAGRVRFAPAVDRLIEIAHDPTDPDLRRAALQALRLMGATAGAGVMVEALLDRSPSVRIAATEGVEEMQIGLAVFNLRISLDMYADEACAEAAYCLGVVGDASDIPLILREAARSISIITRRRCLLGVARLLGVEPEVYRLMLMDGMARDGALQEMLKSRLRRDKELAEALREYSTGDEWGAVHRLAESREGLKSLEGHDVEELFLVAALAAAKN